MALVLYTKIKELQIQEKEIYEFGNWLRNSSSDNAWADSDDYKDSSEEEIPTNADGETMEYPWDDFSYVIVPDSDDEIREAADLAESLGVYNRFDIYDLSRVFFVVK